MPFTGAADWRRAAVLTTSPATRPRSPPGFSSSETSTSPVFSAIRTSSSSSSRIQSRIASAARTARSGSSSWATGAPKTAITASPMNFSTVPPRCSSSERRRSWNGRRIASTSSGSSVSARAVKPTRTVTTLRSRRGPLAIARVYEADRSVPSGRVRGQTPDVALTDAFDRVAPRAHRVEQRVAMVAIAGRQSELDLRLDDGQVEALAVVLDRDHVHALLGDQGQELQQLAGAVGDLRAHDEVAARGRQPATHDGDQQGRIDVPARQQRRDLALAADPLREDGGEGRRAGPFDHQL